MTASADARAADDWWRNLAAARRVQLHHWITDGGGHMSKEPMPGEEPITGFPVLMFSDFTERG